MGHLQTNLEAKELGAGRSGQVFLIETPSGQIARKVFSGDSLASLVHYVLLGADNPYIWNGDFLQCGYYRRKILDILVEYWFDSKLKIARAIGAEWNEELQANQLDAEFIPGRNSALRQPFDPRGSQEIEELLHKVMEPLQKRLIESGFDGLVWQAGKGNPVALNNFLVIDTEQGDRTFVWIDMESGVPALFPLNVSTLFSFYLPKCYKHKTFLFDDVDVKQLIAYTYQHEDTLKERVGNERYYELLDHIGKLDHYQREWRSLSRLKRGVFCQLRLGKITQTQADRYLKFPPLWYIKELKKVVPKVVKKLFVDLPVKITQKIRNISFTGFFRDLCKLIISRRFRTKVARDYVIRRIEAWRDRHQLTDEESDDLLARLDRESGSDYVSDLGVHLGMKVFVKAVEYGIFPIVYAAGFINEFTLALILLMGGALSRTVYTGFRMFQSAAESKEIPWLAFFVGMIPLMIGNIAYPCQMLYSAAGQHGKVASFIVYDTFTRIGGAIPIWGGEDTLTEHFFNQGASHVIRLIGRLKRHRE
ncbi:hypothetical protein [Egbenema bharatensis]|uniref:hypothetical protein n=1 Tax=Egbenema bharatensis TaxID=3463334 RepID=UPI003A847760